MSEVKSEACKVLFQSSYQLQRLLRAENTAHLAEHIDVIGLTYLITRFVANDHKKYVAPEVAQRISERVWEICSDKELAQIDPVVFGNCKIGLSTESLAERLATYKAIKANPELDDIPF